MKRAIMETYLNYANLLADTAGKIACRYFRAPMGITQKEGGYPVTQADKEIELVIREYLAKQYPDHGVLGEEYDEKKGNEYLWVIDPIDGTTAFAAGKPTFTTLIALFEQGRPLFGIIDQPFLQERWVGVQGEKTQFNGKISQSSQISKLKSARLNCTTPDMFKDGFTQKIFAQLKSQVASVSYGGDAYAYGLLAQGHIEVILEADLKFYDVAALVPVIESAGGVITDWVGNAITESFDGKCIAAGNVELHGKVLGMINNF